MQNFKFKKKYGQNFLQSEEIANKIVESINPKENDLILEIGPGVGAITKKLKIYNTNIIAIEIDTDTKEYLDKIEDEKTKIIYGDFLEINIKKTIEKIKHDRLYIIGNLPYYITTPILEHIIDSNIDETSITVMVQKEVAERFLASNHTKEYGYMTVLLNYWYKVEKIVEVKREFFSPVPNVDSTVIKLTKKKQEKVDYEKFKNLLKESFQFKRKTIYNNLKNRDKNKLEEILIKHGETMQSRAEDLDLETFIELSKNL